MTSACIDGNEAAARVAYSLSEVIAIYPITPASPMGELADAWAATDCSNLWGAVPEIVELQSEAGAAGTLHGALQTGSLATTFTASQGLLLMLPNMFKIAGELTPAVIHVAARALATHALSIFGDHSDVMAARSTGFAMLCASSVQEAQDFAAVSHAATLRSRIPFLHFFDGFRTSHEINRIDLIDDEVLHQLVREDDVEAHKLRRLRPTAPVIRGTAQNPDVFFQAREAANQFHDAVPGIVKEVFDELAALTGRQYGLVDYEGAPDAERVIVIMGSGSGAVGEAVTKLVADGEKVGLLTVRLFRPFPTTAFLEALPASVRSIAVLDRTKEPGAVGEPLFQDVVTTLAESDRQNVRTIGGRYGLGSKEFTPAMAKTVLEEAAAETPKRRFTVGIVDDVSGLSLEVDDTFRTESRNRSAVFYALGSDGTVGANKASVKIVGSEPGLHAQGYFVYDSKKSGSMTVSHLRFGPDPIRSTYLVQEADLVACHQFGLLDRFDVLADVKTGGTFLLNAPYAADEVWGHLPTTVQQRIIERDLRVFTIDAAKIARELGMPGRINTVMQPCFFVLTDVMDKDAAITAINESIVSAYGRRGRLVVERNEAAVERALEELAEVPVPEHLGSDLDTTLDALDSAQAVDSAEFIERVTMKMIAGEGDLLPVSAMPIDGTFPSGTTKFEKRRLAAEIPVWEPDLCIDCGKCAIVCPHGTIRMKAYEPSALVDASDNFLTKNFRSRELDGYQMTIQVAPDDCTGCGICVEVCPAKDKTKVKRKAINMQLADEHHDVEAERWDFFKTIPELDRTSITHGSVKNSQLLEPLFEFSGACSGCGETPYLKLLTQLFGDRLVVANATGCSSIYGGNLPTTPWSKNENGLGPAWSNSLFEDNAEFGLGMRLGIEHHQREARRLLTELADSIGVELADSLLANTAPTESGVIEQRTRVGVLKERLADLAESADDTTKAKARRLETICDELVRSSTWIVGGDGWAYDIGFGGVDQVLSSDQSRQQIHSVFENEMREMLGGGQGEQLHKRITQLRNEYFDARGNPRGGYKQLQVEITEVQQRLEEKQDELQGYEEKVDKLERQQKELVAYQADNAQENAKQSLERAQQAIAHITELQKEVEAGEDKVKRAEAEREVASNVWDGRTNLIKEHSTSDNEVKARRDAVDTKEAEIAPRNKRLDEQQNELRKLQSRRPEIETKLRRARDIEALRQLLDDFQRLEKVLKEAKAADSERRRSISELGAIHITEAMMSEIRKIERVRDLTGERLNAVATRLQHKLDPGINLRLGEQTLTGKGDVRLTEVTELVLKGMGSITIIPGGEDLQTLQRELDEQNHQLTQMLAEAGADTMEKAEQDLQRSKTLESRRDQHEAMLNGLAPEGMQALEDQHGAVSACREELLSRLGEISSDEKQTDELEAEAESLQQQIGQREETLKTEEKVTQKLREDLAAAKADVKTSTRSRDSLTVQIEQLRKENSDDELEKGLTEAEKTLSKVERSLKSSQQALDNNNPELAETELERTRKILDHICQDIQTLERDIRDARVELTALGQKGLAEELATLQSENENVKLQFQQSDNRARALGLLQRTLDTSLQQAKEAIAQPITDKLLPYLRQLIPGAAPLINEELILTGIQREGIVEPFENLSIGTREQVAVLVRLAYADLLSAEGVPVMVILDDALVNSDDERRDRMKAILYQASKRYQILLLTCHEKEYRDSGGKLIRLE